MSEPQRSSPPSTRLWCALAGLHAGVLSGLVALAWHLVVSAASGAGATSTVRALAAGFYRSPFADQSGWRMFLAGAALHLVAAGLVGTLFGIATARVSSFRTRLLLGILFGVLWYYAWFPLLKPPARYDFYSSSGLLAGHLLFGAILGASWPLLKPWGAEHNGAPGQPPDPHSSGASSL